MSSPERVPYARWADGVGRWLGLVPPIVFFLLATFQLTRLPLWWDEGGSLDFLDRSLTTVAALDTHPPGYHLALLAWTSMMGRSPFAVRVLSALIGTLAVAVFGWALSRLAAHPRTQASALSALLLACSPFLLHHAREARMYALAIGLAALSLGLLAPLLRAASPRRPTWIAYTLTLAAGMYVHLGFVAVVAAEAVAAGLSLRHRPGRWRAWLGVALGLALALAPWAALLVSARGVVLNDTRLEAGARVDVFATGLEVARQIAAGTDASADPWGWAPLVVLAALAAVGVWLWRKRLPEVVALLGLLAFGIAGAARINYGLDGAIAVAARLGFAALPGLLGLVAAALIGMARPWRLAALVAVAALGVPGLWRVLDQPIDPNEDMRPVIARIQALAQPDDAVLYTFRWQNGDLASYWPNHQLQPIMRVYDEDDVGSYVADLASAHRRIWLLNYGTVWGNSSDAIYPLLETQAAIADRAQIGATEVVLVAFVPTLADPAPARRPIGSATVSFAPVAVRAHPGDVVPIRVRWAAAPAAANTFLHLGAADAAPLAQLDRAVADLPNGELAAALLIPPGTPAGRYAVFAGLYDPATGARVAVSAPAGCDTVDRLCLGTIDVAP